MYLVKLRLLSAIVLAISCFKLLLLKSYRSTDFEVHRNWMAITSSLPIEQWYFEATSIWTLDYPPMFAYFERFLSLFAGYFDPDMLKIENLNYASFNTVFYQKLSVTLTDIVYITICTAIIFYFKPFQRTDSSILKQLPLVFLSILNVGLFLVDHIHFQYNGVLFGLLLVAVYGVLCNNHFLVALSFSIVVCMKHLFVLFAPLFGVYLITSIGMQGWSLYLSKQQTSRGILYILQQSMMVAVTILSITVITFGPFLYLSIQRAGNWTYQIEQIITRLFPFGRGLIHAYWAPNLWALYCFTDKVLYLILKRIRPTWLPMSTIAMSTEQNAFQSTSGLVGEYTFYLFPKVTATHCLLLVVCSMLPILGTVVYTIFKTPQRTQIIFVRSLTLLSMSTFMLGYHVHEKAILIPWILQGFLIQTSELDNFIYLLLSSIGSVSLFPLIPGSSEWIIKVLVSVAFLAYSYHNLPIQQNHFLIRFLHMVFIVLAGIVIYEALVHEILFRGDDGVNKLPFLPLMIYSVVCAVFTMITWGCLAYSLWRPLSSEPKVKNH